MADRRRMSRESGQMYADSVDSLNSAAEQLAVLAKVCVYV